MFFYSLYMDSQQVLVYTILRCPIAKTINSNSISQTNLGREFFIHNPAKLVSDQFGKSQAKSVTVCFNFPPSIVFTVASIHRFDQVNYHFLIVTYFNTVYASIFKTE